MLRLSHDKWLDLKNDFIESVDYDMEEETLYRYDDTTGNEVEAGEREIYYFEKAGAEIRLQADIKPKVNKTESLDKNGNLKVNYEEIPGEFMVSVTIQVKNEYGDYEDSAAFDGGRFAA